MWTLIALLLLAALGVAAFIAGTVALVLYLIRVYARRRGGDPQRR